MSLVEMYRKKLKCIEPEDMRVKGDYDSASASLLIMRLIRCDETSEVECKSDDKITEFLRGKFLFIVQNERLFDSDKY